MLWGRGRHCGAGGDSRCAEGEGREEVGLSGHLQRKSRCRGPGGSGPGVCEGRRGQCGWMEPSEQGERAGGDARGKKGAHPVGPHLGAPLRDPGAVGNAEQKQNGA